MTAKSTLHHLDLPCCSLRRRYLILDILGQGTFGQVVKCQNMKTHEIVAVKVVKNKPAYFNQSMMEVTILELVCPVYLALCILLIRSSSSTRIAIRTTSTISSASVIHSFIGTISVSSSSFCLPTYTNSSSRTSFKG